MKKKYINKEDMLTQEEMKDLHEFFIEELPKDELEDLVFKGE